MKYLLLIAFLFIVGCTSSATIREPTPQRIKNTIRMATIVAEHNYERIDTMTLSQVREYLLNNIEAWKEIRSFHGLEPKKD